MDKERSLDKLNDFVVIGAGRLGRSVATHLFSHGKEVLVIDKNQVNVNMLNGKVSTAVTTDAISVEVLHSLGVQNFDCAIVCIATDLESSLLVCQNCKDLGVGYLIACAQSEQHGKILESLGIDMIIYPEEFVGKKLATLLANPGINELTELTEEFKIFEFKLPVAWEEKLISEVNMRRKYKLSIVFIKRGEEVFYPEPEFKLVAGDSLVVAGESSKINAIVKLINNTSDVGEQLNAIFNDDEA